MTAPTTPAAASQQLWQYLLAGDTDAAAALIDDAAVFVHMGATLDKQQELDALRNQLIVLKNRELQETSARIIGATGIVLNKIRLTAAVKRQQCAGYPLVANLGETPHLHAGAIPQGIGKNSSARFQAA